MADSNSELIWIVDLKPVLQEREFEQLVSSRTLHTEARLAAGIVRAQRQVREACRINRR
jgi:hypothetical protein